MGESGGQISITQFRREMHCGYDIALRILGEEGVALHKTLDGSRARYEIDRGAADELILRHGSEAARQARLDRPHTRKGAPISPACPYCGTAGRQFRANLTRDGLERARCGRCWRTYTPGVPRRTVFSGKCPYCGDTEVQYRIRKERKSSTRLWRCARCQRHYGVTERRPGEFVSFWRRTTVESTCPGCGRTGMQKRGDLLKNGMRWVQCGHCRRRYQIAEPARGEGSGVRGEQNGSGASDVSDE